MYSSQLTTREFPNHNLSMDQRCPPLPPDSMVAASRVLQFLLPLLRPLAQRHSVPPQPRRTGTSLPKTNADIVFSSFLPSANDVCPFPRRCFVSLRSRRATTMPGI